MCATSDFVLCWLNQWCLLPIFHCGGWGWLLVLPWFLLPFFNENYGFLPVNGRKSWQFESQSILCQKRSYFTSFQANIFAGNQKIVHFPPQQLVADAGIHLPWVLNLTLLTYIYFCMQHWTRPYNLSQQDTWRKATPFPLMNAKHVAFGGKMVYNLCGWQKQILRVNPILYSRQN